MPDSDSDVLGIKVELKALKQQILVSILVSKSADSVYCVLPYYNLTCPRGSRTFDPTYQIGRSVRPPGRLKKNPTFAEFDFQTAQKRQQCRPRRLSCRK